MCNKASGSTHRRKDLHLTRSPTGDLRDEPLDTLHKDPGKDTAVTKATSHHTPKSKILAARRHHWVSDRAYPQKRR